MPVEAGTRIGPYEVLGSLGAGGMGEVYKARDTRLERSVAIKFSKEAFNDRFRNEALAIAALNHPNIATLHDVGPDYLVMEHVDGKPLRGPVPVPEFLRLAGQIADALEHAHQQGIVHRDLKPSNILIAKSGVKVLDFGLARRASPKLDESQDTLSEAVTVAGTPRYMSPEQIDGRKADQRSDVFGFGLVLYELLTGEHAFEGKSAASVMAAILEKPPKPILQLKPDTPPALAEVVETCLAKDPADRWQSVRELKHAMRWAASRDAPAPLGSRRSWAIAAAAATAGCLLASAVAFLARSTPPKPLPIRLEIGVPPSALAAVAPEVSPDGRNVAFQLAYQDNPPQIFVRGLDSTEARAFPGTQPGTEPFWSPDGREIAFWSEGGGLQKLDLAGGRIRSVCPDCRASGVGSGSNHGATWGAAGEIVYSDVGKLYRVSASGGPPEALGALVPGELGRFRPRFLPDGRRYLYLSLGSRKEDQGIYVGSLDSDLRQRIVATEFAAAYAAGHLVYVQDATLVAQPFDAARLSLSGEPVAILREEVDRTAGPMAGGAASFSPSSNVLAWLPSMSDVGQLTWFDRSGRKLGTIGEPIQQFIMDLSPDEKTLAVCPGAFGSKRDIWMVDVASGARRRLTFDPNDDCGAVFSPDGKRIVFFSDRRGVRELYQKNVDGSGDEERIAASSDVGLSPDDWSADGRFVSYNAARPGQSHDLFVLPFTAAGASKPVPFQTTPAVERQSTISPNGRYLAYQSNEPGVTRATGVYNVFVREITASGEPGPGKWQVSPLRGFLPRWSADGRELFFFDPPTLMAVDVRTDGPTFVASQPKPLGIQGVRPFLVSRDGQRFLEQVPITTRPMIRVLVNWLPSGR